MLRQLHIQNLAIIEDLTLELGDGLNCFTGQTGAGKSLILGAFELLLGLRSGGAGGAAELLRSGAEEGRVSGLFEIHRDEVADQVAAVIDQPVADDRQLLITRKLFASGRSSTSINGQPATAAMVKTLGQILVDIHGQHDHQYLLQPANQLHILDAFGRSLELRYRFADQHRQLRDMITRRDELNTSTTLRRQQLELYEFQAQEIDDAELVEGEYEELKARHGLLSNLQRIREQAGGAYAALYDGEASIIERLQVMVHMLIDLGELDPTLQPMAEQVRDATLALQECAFDLGRYNESLDVSPGELAEIEDRLNTLHRLASKYAGNTPGSDPVAEMIDYRNQIQHEIDRLRGEHQDQSHLDLRIDEAREAVQETGEQLTAARQLAAKKLIPQVEAQLKELGMADAAFDVAFESADATPAGLETIEMLVRTNPGQPVRPLRRIASGGELSRIMLALKTILADADRTSVLVFDEIDANIGGRMGTVIGRKLRALSSVGHGAGHQVLCITHLPQIAAFAGRHLRIVKIVTGKGKSKSTSTQVVALDSKSRVDELAEMLAGKDVTATTRKQARELIQTADA